MYCTECTVLRIFTRSWQFHSDRCSTEDLTLKVFVLKVLIPLKVVYSTLHTALLTQKCSTILTSSHHHAIQYKTIPDLLHKSSGKNKPYEHEHRYLQTRKLFNKFVGAKNQIACFHSVICYCILTGCWEAGDWSCQHRAFQVIMWSFGFNWSDRLISFNSIKVEQFFLLQKWTFPAYQRFLFLVSQSMFTYNNDSIQRSIVTIK